MDRCIGSKTSVYTGSFTDDYRSLLSSDSELGATYAATGLATSILANRISWFFDLKGPSVNLDSACSSSLMALDIACKGLRSGEASMVGLHYYDPNLVSEDINPLTESGRRFELGLQSRFHVCPV